MTRDSLTSAAVFSSPDSCPARCDFLLQAAAKTMVAQNAASSGPASKFRAPGLGEFMRRFPFLSLRSAHRHSKSACVSVYWREAFIDKITVCCQEMNAVLFLAKESSVY